MAQLRAILAELDLPMAIDGFPTLSEAQMKQRVTITVAVSKKTTYATRADQLLGQAISQVGVSQKFVSEIPVSSSVFQHL